MHDYISGQTGPPWSATANGEQNIAPLDKLSILVECDIIACVYVRVFMSAGRRSPSSVSFLWGMEPRRRGSERRGTSALSEFKMFVFSTLVTQSINV